MIRFRFRLIALLLIPFLTLTACSTPEEGDPFSAVDPGGRMSDLPPLPEFELETMDGGVLRHTDLTDQITVVNFWATWCGPCVIEIPEFVAIKEEWKDRPFEIIGVSLDEEGFDIVRPFAEEFFMNYPQVLDPRGELGEQFGGAYVLPVTFIVDGSGTIIAGHSGLFPLKDYRYGLDKLVTELEAS